MTPAKVLSLISEMVGRSAIRGGSPTAPAAADLLDEVGDRWNCWRIKSETIREHRHRLQVHLHTLVLAIEADLTLLDALDPAAYSQQSENPDAR